MYVFPKEQQFMQAGHTLGHNVSLNKYQRMCIQAAHTLQHVFLGTKFVMKEQKANNTKESFREDKQDWATFPTRYQHVL